ncbi:S-layer homology domain-containing protein [Paenibacillus mendelii]|uniref:S-layer homology domain-containing protein n=1 Tax=Paenibacillus mendelii TaxID=206163 RepID=A0ABV6JFB6_9BACL|nr:S-layer homology domain-containing protein [Paenibacillus mendelii]MCQ6561560.1 S-layer homology domain-containing protein [Paenibacillus mendelii]
MAPKFRRVSIGLLGLTLALSPASAFADQSISDFKGHWAEQQIQAWITAGNLAGFDDGTVRPNQVITRAEFMTMVNRLFALQGQATIDFKDLPATNWAYSEIAKAVNAGYAVGSTDHLIRANDSVTRQESAVMIARLLGLKSTQENTLQSFKDEGDIAAWSKESVAALVEHKIVNGLPGGLFAPKKALTRAEAVVMIEAALNVKKASAAVTYDKAGTYGPASGTEKVQGNVVVSAPSVTLQNMEIDGDLILAEGIGNGDMTLKNVKVHGTTYIRGGGANSIHLVDSVLVQVIVNKKDGTVRVVAQGSTRTESVILQSSVKLEESGVTGAGFTDVELSDQLPADSQIEILGTFDTVEVQATQIHVKLSQGSIEKLIAEHTALNNTIELDKEALINHLVLDSITKLLGAGQIKKATISEGAEGSTFDYEPANVEGPKRDEIIILNKPVTGGGFVGGGSGSSGGGTIIVTNPEQYVQTQDFGYWSDQEAYNVGFKIDLTKLSWNDITSIEVSLQDAQGNVLAKRTAATSARLNQLKADDLQYGDLDGQFSAAFIERNAAAENDYWASTAYNFAAPSKAVITIKDKNNKVYIVTNNTLSPTEPIIVANPEEYVQTQDFGYWVDEDAYNVGFKIDLTKLSWNNITSIEVSLQDAQGNELAKRTAATAARLNQLKADDELYSGLDGQLSAAFIEREAAAENEYWASTAYDFAAPAKAVIKIKDKHYRVYTVTNSTLYPAAPEEQVASPEEYVQTQDFSYWAGQTAYNVGFKIDQSKLSWDAITSIEVSLQDAEGVELAKRTAATAARLNQLKDSDKDGNGEYDGQLSAAFIERNAADENEYWASTAYDFSAPAKAVITIKDKHNRVYTVMNSTLFPTAPEEQIANPEEYVQTQDFGYWVDEDAYNVGFKIDLTKLSWNNITSIEVSLQDAQGNELAKRTAATAARLNQLKADDELYSGLDGQLSAAFIERDEAVENDYWASTAYDFTVPSKAVITIKDKYNMVYTVTNNTLYPTPAP